MREPVSRREELLQQIIPLFNKHGYWKIRVDDIASALKISKKTLYIEFENKKDIIKNVIEMRVSALETVATRVDCQDYNAITSLLMILKDFYSFIDINQDKLNFEILKKYYAELYTYQHDYIYDAIRKVIAANYERGKEEGLYVEQFSADFIGKFWADAFLNNRSGDILQDDPEKLSKQKDDTIRLLLNGMITEKGKTILQQHFDN